MFERIGDWLYRRRKPEPSLGTQDPWTIPYSPVATESDVFHLFRLLLGRHPHREEWAGHSAKAGQPLPGVVASYLNSLECARRDLLAPPARPSLAVAEGDGFRLHVDLEDAAVGRHVHAGRYEPDVTAVFRRLLRPGLGVIDVGATIGYFARRAADGEIALTTYDSNGVNQLPPLKGLGRIAPHVAFVGELQHQLLPCCLFFNDFG